jgi:hypothetical protein
MASRKASAQGWVNGEDGYGEDGYGEDGYGEDENCEDGCGEDQRCPFRAAQAAIADSSGASGCDGPWRRRSARSTVRPVASPPSRT